MIEKKALTHVKDTLSQKAYHAIKLEILRGEVQEGTFLSEAEVRKRYGIGRTPFREACNRLHHEGVLEVVPRRGYLVPQMSFRDVRDLFEARLFLEAIIAELAAARASTTQIDELERIAKRKVKPGNSHEEYEQIVTANTEFHFCLASMSRNRVLIRVITGILEQSERLSYLELLSGRWRREDIQMMHQPIVDAIRKQNPAAARKAVARDIRQGRIDIFDQNPIGIKAKRRSEG